MITVNHHYSTRTAVQGKAAEAEYDFDVCRYIRSFTDYAQRLVQLPHKDRNEQSHNNDKIKDLFDGCELYTTIFSYLLFYVLFAVAQSRFYSSNNDLSVQIHILMSLKYILLASSLFLVSAQRDYR